MHRSPRRSVRASRALVVALVVVVAAVLAGFGSAAAPKQPPPPKKNLLMGGSTFTGKPSGDPIKIALLADVAGKIGGFGPAQIRATRLMAKLANQNGGIMGRPVEIVVRDDQADPSVTAREMQSVIRTERVNLVLGDVLSSALLAQAPLAKQFKTATIAGAGADVQFVQQQASIYQGMVSASSQVDACGFAIFIGRRHKEWKRIGLLVSKFAYGEDHARDFVACLKRYAPGARVVVRKEFELGTQNFVPFITAVQGARPDFIMTSSFGTDFVRFYQQYTGAGGSAPIAAFTDLDAVKAIGNNVKPGFVYAYSRALYTELPAAAKPFVDAFVKEYKIPPPDYAVTGMGAFLAYKAAVEKARTTDAEDVMEAYRCLTYYEPRGWIKVRTLNGQADVPDYNGALLPDRKLGHPRLDPKDRMAVFASQVWPSEAQVRGRMPKDAVRTAADCS